LVTWAKNFGFSIRLETGFAILALLMASLLSATPIPEPDFLQNKIETPRENQRVGDYEVQMTMAPGAPGLNSVDVTVRRNVLLVDDVRVEVQFVAPERDFRSDWLPAESVDQGLFAFVDDSIDGTGYWLTLVDLIDAQNRLTRIVFSWQISKDAEVLDSLSPSLLTILAALATLASILYVLYPAGRAFAGKMDWSFTTMFLTISKIRLLKSSIPLCLMQLRLRLVAHRFRNTVIGKMKPCSMIYCGVYRLWAMKTSIMLCERAGVICLLVMSRLQKIKFGIL
jgi:hypothetical protein